MSSPLLEIAFRTGFTHPAGPVPALEGILHSYPLGDSAASLGQARAPLILFLDSAASVPERALRRATQLLASNRTLAGLTFGGPALRAVYGEDDGLGNARSIAQTIQPLAGAPSFCTLIQRSRLDFEAGYTTAEFLLLDAATRGPVYRIGGVQVELDHGQWAKDLIVGMPERLAADYARFIRLHPREKVPPQFRIEVVGSPATAGLAPMPGRSRVRFSIICPVFKPRFLKAMIASVRRQTYPHWELLVLVDGPPPEALAEIRGILAAHAEDPRVRSTEQENRGTGPSRHRLGEMATGDFVLPIDDDDMLHEEALATFAAAIAAHEEAVVFRGGAQLVGFGDDYLPPRPRLVIDGITNDIFEVNQPWAIRRDVLQELGGFEWDADLRRAGEDTILFHKIDRARLPTRLIDQPLYYRRLSTANLSLEFKPEEALAHFENLDRRYRPAEWQTSDRAQEKVGRFQRSTTAYRHALSGQQVVCSTKFFQFRTVGSLEDVTIDLELTTVCNATCTFCPRGEMPDKKTFMAVDLVQKLAAQLAAMARPPHVVFCGIGESTLHPHLEEITQLVARAGSRISMTSNGARMSVALFERLVAAGMTSINFSINAATPETHAKVMKLRDFARVRQAVEEVIAARNAAHPHVRIQVSLVVCDANEAEVEAFVEYWRPRGPSQIWLHPLNNRAGMLSAGVRPADLGAFQRRYARDPLVVVDVFGDRDDTDGLCKIAKSLIFISAEGETRLCAMDYQRQTNFGNVGMRRLEETHLEKLLAFAAGKTRALCHGCSFCPGNVPWPKSPEPALSFSTLP